MPNTDNWLAPIEQFAFHYAEVCDSTGLSLDKAIEARIGKGILLQEDPNYAPGEGLVAGVEYGTGELIIVTTAREEMYGYVVQWVRNHELAHIALSHQETLKFVFHPTLELLADRFSLSYAATSSNASAAEIFEALSRHRAGHGLDGCELSQFQELFGRLQDDARKRLASQSPSNPPKPDPR